MINFTERENAITFSVRAQPRAARTALAGESEGSLKIKIAAPPVDGAANEELIRFLAKFFALPRQSISIISGGAAKYKIVRLTGLTGVAFIAKLTKTDLSAKSHEAPLRIESS